mmetsp:Transcript_15465/g.23595  ORF Transcript_15465/g.23595 Transcript_15465/m.23595 type:complete len:133 (+) Transcript_15465:393-791(+)
MDSRMDTSFITFYQATICLRKKYDLSIENHTANFGEDNKHEITMNDINHASIIIMIWKWNFNDMRIRIMDSRMDTSFITFYQATICLRKKYDLSIENHTANFGEDNKHEITMNDINHASIIIMMHGNGISME